jgi:hypothetical protein
MSTTESEPLTTSAAHGATQVARRVAPRTMVGALWLFAILNYLYCDVLSLHEPAYLTALLSGSAGGVTFNQPMLLAASVLMTIPMAGVLISRIAPHRLARWYAAVAGIVMTVVQIGTMGIGTATTLHYLYFSVIEIVTTAFIAWYAIARWRIDS